MGPALLLSLLAATGGDETGGDEIVAVFDIENRGVKTNAKTLDRLTDYVATMLAASDGVRVVPRGELRRALLAEKAESYRACYDESCQIEIGKEVAATESLSTEISRLGNTCVVSMQLYDLRTAASVDAASARGGCSEDTIVALVERAAGELTGNAVAAPIPAARTIAPPPRPKNVKAAPTRRLLDRRAKRWDRKDRTAARLLQQLLRSGREDGGATQFRLASLYADHDTRRAEAIEQFETLLANWPAYRRADEAMFELGRLRHDAGDRRGATKVWTALVRRFPTSPYAASASFGLAEHLYDAGRLAAAEAAYRRATRSTEHPRIAEIAQYKRAICQYRLGNGTEAYRTIAALLASGPSPKVRLAAETARDGFDR